ncbi:MAG TPA: carboxypeptidase regulatory-like domain-containing protein [Terriglobales bacterium]|nr:carboxypeptidase regulatory-like domain-containing protein [Terriglobales bacterium]
MGTVVDPSGAVVPNAAISFVNKATNVRRETATNHVGLYRLDAMDPGIYDATAKAAGFKVAVQAGITIQANRIAAVDFALELGQGKTRVEVYGDSLAAVQASDALRGGNFPSKQILGLPLPASDTNALALLLPGTLNPNTASLANGFNVSVNGQTAQNNNFMIDGMENNETTQAGPAFLVTNADAIQEVVVQTTQFGAEFGRAGGAVINHITKSGTNELHGTAAWYYRSNGFDATDNSERLGASPSQEIPPRLVRNIPSFTLGGPVVIPGLYDGRGRTFFFAGAQWDRSYALALSANLVVPTDAGVATLQALAGSCPNAALYLDVLGGLRGGGSVSDISVAIPPNTFAATGSCNGTDRAGMSVEVGTVSRAASQATLDSNHVVRIDHAPSAKQAMSFRWLYDDAAQAPAFNNLEGFDRGFAGKLLSALFADTYAFSSSWTNEFRFSYGRIVFDFPGLAPDVFHANLANYSIPSVTGFGLRPNIPQFRFTNNWQYQDTVSWVKGRHQIRFGVDFLRQLVKQRPPFNERGTFVYRASTAVAGFPSSGAVTGLANFIDDFGGSGGSLARVFGSPVFYPNTFRHSYFFQDNWRLRSDFNLNLGLRYENFGQPANVFQIPAFTDYSATDFATPNQVAPDNNNLGPAVGFAWNPAIQWPLWRRIFGDKRSVLRGGFQVTYETYFNNLLSNIAGTAPNTLGGQINSVQGTAANPVNPRGSANFSAQFASIAPVPLTPFTPQDNLFDPHMRNPYVLHWSLGLEREMVGNVTLEVAYVATAGRALFRTRDVNPIVAPGTPPIRFMNSVGPRTIRDNSGSNIYHSLQLIVRRRFSPTPAGSLHLEGAWTWSRNIDNITEVFPTLSTGSQFESLPTVLGFSNRVDRGVSDNHRLHRLVIHYIWEVRGPRAGFWSTIAGGWALGGVTQLVTGAPYTILNGTDRNGDGQAGPDRPDLGNPDAPFRSRAVRVNLATCATGLFNPETQTCVTSMDVHWVEGAGLPGPNTAPRNSLFTPGTIQWDLLAVKRFSVTESVRLEYRAETINLFNRQNFGVPPGLTVNGSTADTFLNSERSEALGRTIRMGLKLHF